jgi:hypothetical protein
MNLNVGEILTTAWRILWKHKILWIFGILAGCGANGAPRGNVSYSFSSGDVGSLPPGVQNFFNGLSQHPAQAAGIVAAAFALVCVIVLVFVALGVLGRIGLISGTRRADGGVAHLGFGELVEASRPYFWRIFGLHLLLGLAAFVVILLFVVLFVGFAAVTLGLGLFCLIPLICVLIPLAWLAAVWFEQTDIAIVLEDLSIPNGLARGWKVLSSNWGPMIIMALILFIGSAIVSFILVVPFVLAAFPAAFAFISASPNLQQGLLALGLVCACIYLPFLILANGIVQTYYHSAWTLTFLRLTSGTAAAPTPPEIEPLNA